MKIQLLAPSIGVLTLLLAGLSSCAAAGAGSTEAQLAIPYDSPDCICGTGPGDLLGCSYGPCVSGAGNPENEDCLCYSPLSAGGFAGAEYTAEGGEGAHLVGAQEQQRERYFYLASGRSYKGTVQSDDGRRVEILTVGGNEMSFAYEDLQPRTVYRLMKARTAENDFDGQLALANYARDGWLFGYARRHYQIALGIDGSRLEEVDREVAELRTLAAQDELLKARAALREKRTAEAKEHLTNVIEQFPAETAALEAEHLLGQQFEQEKAGWTVAKKSRSEEIAKQLQPSRKHYERAVKEEHKGLQNTRNTTQAIRSFKSSIQYAKRSYQLLSKFERSSKSTPEVLSAAAELKGQVEKVAIDSNLHAASLYLGRSSHYNALDMTNAALAIDPENQQARRMRQRIENSINSVGWGWGWYPRAGVGPGRGGRRGR